MCTTRFLEVIDETGLSIMTKTFIRREMMATEINHVESVSNSAFDEAQPQQASAHLDKIQ